MLAVFFSSRFRSNRVAFSCLGCVVMEVSRLEQNLFSRLRHEIDTRGGNVMKSSIITKRGNNSDSSSSTQTIQLLETGNSRTAAATPDYSKNKRTISYGDRYFSKAREALGQLSNKFAPRFGKLFVPIPRLESDNKPNYFRVERGVCVPYLRSHEIPRVIREHQERELEKERILLGLRR